MLVPDEVDEGLELDALHGPSMIAGQGCAPRPPRISLGSKSRRSQTSAFGQEQTVGLTAAAGGAVVPIVGRKERDFALTFLFVALLATSQISGQHDSADTIQLCRGRAQ